MEVWANWAEASAETAEGTLELLQHQLCYSTMGFSCAYGNAWELVGEGSRVSAPSRDLLGRFWKVSFRLPSVYSEVEGRASEKQDLSYGGGSTGAR